MVGREEALQGLRRAVTRREFEFASVLEVTDGGLDGFLVSVRSGQRLDLHVVVLAADEQALALDHSVGEPLHADDVNLWADGVVTMLMELLDTGGLRWGRRIMLSDGSVAIDPTLEPDPPSPWSISPVPLQRPTRAGQRRLRRLMRGTGSDHVAMLGGRITEEPDPSPGGHLRDMGFDVRPGRAAHANGRLVQWLQLYLDDSIDAPPAGQLVVARRDKTGDVVLLEHLECKPDVPQEAVEELVLAGVHAAADAGAHVIEYGPGGQHIHSRLAWQQEGSLLRLRATDVP